MALRDGLQPRAVVVEKRQARERLINDVEKLHRQLPLAKARELGNTRYQAISFCRRGQAGRSSAPRCSRPGGGGLDRL